MSEQICQCCGESFLSPFQWEYCGDCRRAGCADLADPDLCGARSDADDADQTGIGDW